MSEATRTEQELLRATEASRDELVVLTQELVRIPSENIPPGGQEKPVQLFIQKWLADINIKADLIDLPQVKGLAEHELFFRGQGYEKREYKDRPNLAARLKGQGKGKTLILSGHIDTMPSVRTHWQYDSFGGEIIGNKLYGRGSPAY